MPGIYQTLLLVATGGNLVVLFQDEPFGCPDSQLPEYVLQIVNSTFSYGVNLDYFISKTLKDFQAQLLLEQQVKTCIQSKCMSVV